MLSRRQSKFRDVTVPLPLSPNYPKPHVGRFTCQPRCAGPLPTLPTTSPPHPFPQTTPRSPNPTKLTSSHRPQPDPLPDTTPPRPHLLTIGDIKNTSTPLHVSGDVAAASGARFFTQQDDGAAQDRSIHDSARQRIQLISRRQTLYPS